MTQIRFAMPSDAGDILKIYAPFIISTSVTFEVDVPQEYEMERRIVSLSSTYPYIVCEIDNEIAGYAFASSYHPKAAYAWNTEVTVYIKEQYQRCNVASALYYALFELLKKQGFFNIIALVTASNEKSENFHTSFGFQKVGVMKNVGYKLNAWHNVSIYEKFLVDEENTPTPKSIIAIGDIDSDKCDKIFQNACKIVKMKHQPAHK